MKQLIDSFCNSQKLNKEELHALLNISEEDREYLSQRAREISLATFGKKIYLRGLIEISCYCKNDCYYCGIRRSNKNAERYRLTPEEILLCADKGHELGFRTFVLQGGEDTRYTDDIICSIVESIKSKYDDCAVTLSLGEKSYESYKRYYESGADRYLLRHETADNAHYSKLHPKEMSLENRMRCLYDLKDIGYQVGCGIMVGSPWQSEDTIYKDLEFMQALQPHMIGIGPFIHHKDTPFAEFENGSTYTTLVLLSILRIMFPKVLLPATTALGTADPFGREKGILAGANVLMPNLSPVSVRKKYSLYDNKICTGEEAAECRGCLERRINSIGYTISMSRGDYPDFKRS